MALFDVVDLKQHYGNEEPEEFSEEDLDAVERAILDSGDDEDGFVDLDL